MIQIRKWVREYYHSINTRLDVSEELLEPRLLDGREEELVNLKSTLPIKLQTCLELKPSRLYNNGSGALKRNPTHSLIEPLRERYDNS